MLYLSLVLRTLLKLGIELKKYEGNFSLNIYKKWKSFLNQSLNLRDSKAGSWYIFSIEVNKILQSQEIWTLQKLMVPLAFWEISRAASFQLFAYECLLQEDIEQSIRNLKTVLFNFAQTQQDWFR